MPKPQRKPRLLRTQCTVTSANGLRVTVIIPHPPQPGEDNKTLKARLRVQLKPAVQKLADSMDRVMDYSMDRVTKVAVKEQING